VVFVFCTGDELLFRDDLTLSEQRVGRQVEAWARVRGLESCDFPGVSKRPKVARIEDQIWAVYMKRRTEAGNAAGNFFVEFVFHKREENHMTTGTIATGRVGALGALLRPENYLLVLFAISTTLWTVAFLFYFLSAQVGALIAIITRAAHLRRARA
jgi:hypothetical protein